MKTNGLFSNSRSKIPFNLCLKEQLRYHGSATDEALEGCDRKFPSPALSALEWKANEAIT